MIAVLYEGKKEKRRVELDATAESLLETVAKGAKVSLLIPLRAPCSFSKIVLFDNGRVVVKQYLGSVMMAKRPFAIEVGGT